MEEKRLKLYVWKDVLTDWYSGLICCMAESLEQAVQMIRESESIHKEIRDDGLFEGEYPQVVDGLVVFYVLSGG